MIQSTKRIIMTYEQPQLPYDENALEPVISRKTVEFHYGKHEKAEASLPVADHGLDLNSIPPRINDDGLVYGTVDQAEAPGGQVDLVAVVATNGREGYVYFDAFQEAAGMNATSPDEAVQYMENAEEIVKNLSQNV